MSKNQARKPLEIKISTVVAVAAMLADTDTDKLSSALSQITGGTPDYFEDDFTLLDLSGLSVKPAPGTIDWPALISLFKKHRLHPVAVRNAPASLEEEIRSHGLSIDTVDQSKQFELTPPPSPEIPDVPVAEPAVVETTMSMTNAMVVDTPVRAGQRVYARDSDLILMAVVNPGGEVIADGSIHVYAPLRGRALAGASGNTQARIFSLSMEAELVSIAGVYRTFDEELSATVAGKPAQIRLNSDRLDITPISLK
ncbi:MAG: septum site-determining protein MinC [Oxalobacteraceae bacterium]|jgi:septum site-determining protein MinC|nr:septum site-determining protein MinC [Oxalobacteraceae bacterium]